VSALKIVNALQRLPGNSYIFRPASAKRMVQARAGRSHWRVIQRAIAR
jgi:hypothetical protein